MWTYVNTRDSSRNLEIFEKIKLRPPSPAQPMEELRVWWLNVQGTTQCGFDHFYGLGIRSRSWDDKGFVKLDSSWARKCEVRQQEQSSCSLRSFFPGEATLLNLYGLNDHLEYHILLQVFFQKYHSWNYFWKFFSKSLRKSNDKTYDLLKQEKLPSEYSTSLPGAEISGQTSCRWVEVKKGCLSVELFLELEQRNSISFLGVR